MIDYTKKKYSLPVSPSSQVPSASPALGRDGMTRAELTQTLETFGEARRKQGDDFDATGPEGFYFYAAGDVRVGIIAWDTPESWTLSVFSCARARMLATLSLYRYVSRWRSTCGVGAPYLVEGEDGYAAVLAETTISGTQLHNDTTGWRIIASTIDFVGGIAQMMADDLVDSDGVPFTARGEVGMMAMSSWWEIRDDRIGKIVGI